MSLLADKNFSMQAAGDLYRLQIHCEEELPYTMAISMPPLRRVKV